jgi:hypothetical protein
MPVEKDQVERDEKQWAAEVRCDMLFDRITYRGDRGKQKKKGLWSSGSGG